MAPILPAGAPLAPLSPLSARPHHNAEAAAKPVSRGHLKENAAAAATSGPGAATAGGKVDGTVAMLSLIWLPSEPIPLPFDQVATCVLAG